MTDHNIDTDDSEAVEQFLNDYPDDYLDSIESARRGAGSIWVTYKEGKALGTCFTLDLIRAGWVIVSSSSSDGQWTFMYRLLDVEQQEVERIITETETTIEVEGVQ